MLNNISNNARRSHSGGFSIIEVMIVLVVIAVLSASLIPRFLEQRSASEAKDEYAKVTELRSRIEALFDGDMDFTGVETVWKTQIPKSYAKDSSGNVRSVWKNKVEVSVAAPNGFQIAYTNVPKGIACTEFIKAGRNAGWAEIKVDSNTVLAETTTAQVASFCESNTAVDVITTLAFVHKT